MPRLAVGLPMIQSETPGVFITEADAGATLATSNSAFFIFTLMGVSDACGQCRGWGEMGAFTFRGPGWILPFERIAGVV